MFFYFQKNTWLTLIVLAVLIPLSIYGIAYLVFISACARIIGIATAEIGLLSGSALASILEIGNLWRVFPSKKFLFRGFAFLLPQFIVFTLSCAYIFSGNLYLGEYPGEWEVETLAAKLENSTPSARLSSPELARLRRLQAATTEIECRYDISSKLRRLGIDP